MSTAAAPQLIEQLQHILQATEQPLAMRAIITQIRRLYPRGTRKAPLPPPPADDAIQAAIAAEVAAKRAFEYPGTAASGPRYSAKQPPSIESVIEARVQDRLAAATADPITPAQLGKPGAREGRPAMDAFNAVLKRLLDGKQLFLVGRDRYSKNAPPAPVWYTTSPNKAEFDKIVRAIERLKTLNISASDILAAVQLKLGVTAAPSAAPSAPSAPTAAPSGAAAAKPAAAPAATTATAPASSAPSKPLPALLKEAYDHLCLFVEFRHKLVHLYRLYHEAKKRYPALTVEDFHNTLWNMSQNREIELRVLNEVHKAEQRELAIYRDHTLYYYVQWI
ncbi:hypothetical protein [Tuwongella immobilis]|uniref:Uncharacterized protein n=1 Tax=Tuwongella immobilis TaxID=692036 RepID=A0A6C2YIL2_9BACT|nr:hypothetical protein [Tuwongella immobilis]VIP01204.1 unnamed protein product [Tuwongella immobilis]VTR97834.1 unnamed protein product [Tuwongella immobilis]